MASFEVVADNGKTPIVDEVYYEYATAHTKTVALSKKYLYVSLYKNNRLIEEYGPNEKVIVE